MPEAIPASISVPVSFNQKDDIYDVLVVGASFAGVAAALDRMTSNTDVDALYDLFRSPTGHEMLQRALLEIPIIGMDSNFFSLLRGLLSKHPGLYSSALQAVWWICGCAY